MTRKFGIPAILLFIAAISLTWLAWRGSREATVLVEWSTASELNTAGFNLYRSESPDGPFVLVNQVMIPASADALAGSAYTYKDYPVQPGKRYYYQLEELEFDGGSSRFGPISVQADTFWSAGRLIVLAVSVVAIFLLAAAYMRRRNARAVQSNESYSSIG